jgi:hypothetical protein
MQPNHDIVSHATLLIGTSLPSLTNAFMQENGHLHLDNFDNVRVLITEMAKKKGKHVVI